MKKIFLTVITSIIALTASAQDFAIINPNARTAAMGDATVSATADAYSVYNNAAAPLFEYHSVQAAYTYTSLNSKQFNEGLMSLAGYVKFGQRHSIAFGGRLFNEPKYEADGDYPFIPTDEYGNLDYKVGGFKRPSSKSLEVAYGLKVCDQVALAVTARYLHYSNGLGDKYSALNFDLSLYSQIPMEYREGAMLNLGAQISNGGFSITKNGFTQPLTAKLGASLYTPFGDAHSLLAAVDLGYRIAPAGMNGKNGIMANAGLEYSLMELIKFRAGYAHNLYDYATVGLGLRFMHVQIDGSYWIAAKNCPYNNVFRVGVGLEF